MLEFINHLIIITMKKIALVFSLFAFTVFAVNAQCTKTVQACASKSNSTASVEEKAAELAASVDANIKREVCEKSGTVTYYQKSISPDTGAETWERVEFDASTKKFTKVASASMEKDPETGEVKTKKACCAGKAGGKACAGQSEGSACSKGDKKACCAGKKESSTK